MYVKIINGKGKKPPHENYHECDHVGLHPTDAGDNCIVMIITKGKSDITIEIEKEDVQIYIMNNDGKTIERYVW